MGYYALSNFIMSAAKSEIGGRREPSAYTYTLSAFGVPITRRVAYDEEILNPDILGLGIPPEAYRTLGSLPDVFTVTDLDKGQRRIGYPSYGSRLLELYCDPSLRAHRDEFPRRSGMISFGLGKNTPDRRGLIMPIGVTQRLQTPVFGTGDERHSSRYVMREELEYTAGYSYITRGSLSKRAEIGLKANDLATSVGIARRVKVDPFVKSKGEDVTYPYLFPGIGIQEIEGYRITPGHDFLVFAPEQALICRNSSNSICPTVYTRVPYDILDEMGINVGWEGVYKPDQLSVTIRDNRFRLGLSSRLGSNYAQNLLSGQPVTSNKIEIN